MVKQSYRLYILLALLVFLVDQLIKYFVRIGNVHTTGNLIDIVFVKNTGTMFSLFAHVQAINIFFIIISFIAIIFLIYYAEREQTTVFGIGLVLGGILGNLVDRIFFGAVIDWIAIAWWPIFNIADMAIVSGVFLLIIQVLQQETTK